MARKRMIKPEFWTDSVMVQLPAEARLLFIGMWNFADDYGYIEDEPERLALQILPADDADVDLLLDLLIAAGRVERYQGPDGAYFLYIPHFVDHQKVDHPAKPSYPDITECRKVTIPPHVRRQVAVKYGCEPGERGVASCYYCGNSGAIYWPRNRKGQPGGWVAFSGLELDHFVAESQGGATVTDNIVLACRGCNRSKYALDGLTFASETLTNVPEYSRVLASIQENSAQVKLSKVKLSKVSVDHPTGEHTPARVDDPLLTEPAIVAYREALHLTPTPQQRQLIASTVTDLDRWQAKLDRWKTNGYSPKNLTGLLDSYTKPDTPPGSYSRTNGKTTAHSEDPHQTLAEMRAQSDINIAAMIAAGELPHGYKVDRRD